MRPAFSSRTKRREATALAPALSLFFLTASDMWHPYGDPTRNWSALDRDCAAKTCHDIEWDDRRWNGCAFLALSYGARFVSLLKTYSFRAESTCGILLRLHCTTTLRAVPGGNEMIYRVGKDLMESIGFAQHGIRYP